jgi:hypothetical protein
MSQVAVVTGAGHGIGRPARRGVGGGLLRVDGRGDLTDTKFQPGPDQAWHQRQAIASGAVGNEHWYHIDLLFSRYESSVPGGIGWEKKRFVGASGPTGRMAPGRDQRFSHLPCKRRRRLYLLCRLTTSTAATG